MEHNSDIEKFEIILKENLKKKPSSLYSNANISLNHTNRPQDVLKIVSSQMKAIQKADQLITKNNQGKTNSLKRETIDVYDKVLHKKKLVNKFETQCVSDTQLIDIVKVAEAFDADQDTQDLDVSFTVSDLEKISKNISLEMADTGDSKSKIAAEVKLNQAINKIDDENDIFNDNIENTLVGFTVDFTDVCEEKDRKDMCVIKDKETHSNDVNISGVQTLVNFTEEFVESDKDIFEENEYECIDEDFDALERDRRVSSSPILNKIEPIKTVSEGGTLRERDKERSTSPVFIFKKKSKSPSPLVFNLDSFERFEQLAIPLVEENLDIELTKHLINSQILDKELFLPSKAIKHIANNEQFKKSDIGTNIVGNYEESGDTKPVTCSKFKPKDDKDKHSSTLEDEILFSSDEEDYEPKEIQDLPFTCALETSFYDQPDVLDKTMYVGFQTASNKTIQVCTESFTKAKSILNQIDSSCKRELSLTELVNICDGVSKNGIDNTGTKYVSPDTSEKDDSLDIPDLTKSMLDKLIGVSTQELIDKPAAITDSKFGITEENTQYSDINLSNLNAVINEATQNKNCNDLTLNEGDSKSIQNMETVKNKIYEGFKTANNKIIKLSDAALARCQRVFQDIDIDEKYDQDDRNRLSNKKIEPEKRIDGKTPEAINNVVKEDVLTDINDEIILQEFENIEMCVKTESKEEIPFFKTARHKNIIISDKAADEAVRLFKDLELNLHDNEDSMSNLPRKLLTEDEEDNNSKSIRLEIKNVGFKTASNRDIKISDEAIAKTKILLQDIELDIINTHNMSQIKKAETEMIHLENFKQPSTSKGLTGFQTASNKHIAISDAALLRTKNIFKDIDKPINKNIGSKTEMQEFKTAEEQVEISEQAVLISKNIYNAIPEIDDLKIPNPVSNIIGFQTANNKPVHISAKALERSKKIFQEEMLESKQPIHPNKSNLQPLSSEVGFKTANNKSVVSSNALERCRKIFQEELSDSKLQPTTSGNINSVSNFGFQTANNKPVNISASALEKGRKIFQDEDLGSTNKMQVTKTTESVLSPFQTANNKAVHIPKRALERTKKIFQNLDSRETGHKLDDGLKNKPSIRFNRVNSKEVKTSKRKFENARPFANNTDIHEINNLKKPLHVYGASNSIEGSFKGFQTASKKQVQISKEALDKCKNIFQDIDFSNDFNGQNTGSHTDNHLEEENPKKEVLCGFRTANNAKMCVSAHSMARSKRLFDDIDDLHVESVKDDNTNSDKKEIYPVVTNTANYKENIKLTHFDGDLNKVDNFSGFKTASNKKVCISEQALAKTRQIFQDIDAIKAKEITDRNINNTESLNYIGNKNTAKRFKYNDYDNVKATTETYVKPISDVNKENTLAIINTQLLNNFEETLYTEDFRQETPSRNKRSGSPILSCPRAKKRRFETPYKINRIVDDKSVLVAARPNENGVFTDNYKKNKIYKLKDLRLRNKKPIDPHLTNFGFETLLNLEFEGARNDLTENKLNIATLKDIFSSSVNEKLIPDGWLDNHIKLILWKLISYEACFELNGVCSAKNLLDQLKFRYDKELYDAERPILRKILEKDEVPSKTMVLCIVAVFVDGIKMDSVGTTDNNVELLLSDGWYCAMTCIDKMLTQLVRDKKIVVGSKIVTNGAELLNCEQGVAPWEDTSSVRLKIFGNSTRRARWDARLGCHGNGAILSQLSHVKLDGGKVSKLRLFVARVYPALYVEKFEDGSTVTRSERLEHLHQAKYETDRQNILEKLYEEVEREFTDLESQDSESPWDTKRCVQSGSQIFETVKRSTDSRDLQSWLTSSQTKLLEDHTNKRRERLMEKVQARLMEKIDSHGLRRGRNVVTVLKARVVGVDRAGVVSKGLLSVWKPNDSILDLVREGSWIEVLNVMPTAFRYSEIQISAGRQSLFIQSRYRESDTVKQLLNTFKRNCYSTKELKNTTEYNEIDTAGIIVLIEPSSQEFEPKSQYQNVYLTDKECNMICVNFWGGLQKFGFQNVLDTGQVVACMNLQKRAGNTRHMPQYRATEFSYFSKTPRNVQAKGIVDELNKMSVLDRRRICEECVKLKNSFSVRSTENITPYRINDLINNKACPDSVKYHSEFNLTGLDFESSFRQKDELSPKTLKRKQEVNKRINKLKMYGEPPPLTPIHIINKSKNASSSYKSPMNNDSSPSVAADKIIGRKVEKINPAVLNTSDGESGRNVENKDSPVTLVTKTYVKSAVNPVKLNFDNSEVDQFAEEFEASPPLSLD